MALQKLNTLRTMQWRTRLQQKVEEISFARVELLACENSGVRSAQDCDRLTLCTFINVISKAEKAQVIAIFNSDGGYERVRYPFLNSWKSRSPCHDRGS